MLYIGGIEWYFIEAIDYDNNDNHKSVIWICSRFCNNFSIIPKHLACQGCTFGVKLLERFGDYKKKWKFDLKFSAMDIEGERQQNVQKIKLVRAKREKRAKRCFPLSSSYRIQWFLYNHWPLLTKTWEKCNSRSSQKPPHVLSANKRIFWRACDGFLSPACGAISVCQLHSVFEKSWVSRLWCCIIFSVTFVFESHFYLKSEIFIV